MTIKREDLPPAVQQLLRKSADTGKIEGLRNGGQAVWDAVYCIVNEAFLLGVAEGKGLDNE